MAVEGKLENSKQEKRKNKKVLDKCKMT